MYDLELEAQDLEYTAEWRRQKAQEYPDDKRNIGAALLLERLAKDVLPLVGSAPHLKLSERLNDSSYSFESANDYRRRIGFWEFPSAEEYLSELANF